VTLQLQWMLNIRMELSLLAKPSSANAWQLGMNERFQITHTGEAYTEEAYRGAALKSPMLRQ